MTLQWTGERFLPGVGAEVAYEHYNRYLFSLKFTGGMSVLDLPSGEGFGSNIIAKDARDVLGVDISEEAVLHASNKYKSGNLAFRQGSMADLSFLPDASRDVITCFEGIEHISAEDQTKALNEFKRVLKPTGVLLISTPNKKTYSDDPGYSNPYHLREYYAEEFNSELMQRFGHVEVFGQKVFEGSILSPLNKTRSANYKGYALSTGGDEKILSISDAANDYTYLIAVCGQKPIMSDLDGEVLVDLYQSRRKEIIEELSILIRAHQEDANSLRQELACERGRISYKIVQRIVSMMPRFNSKS